jgi:hypothetical protein
MRPTPHILTTGLIAALHAAPLHAQDRVVDRGAATEAPVVLTLDAGCASVEAGRALIDELRLRLPTNIEVLRAADERPAWRLGWTMDQGACALVLSDVEQVAALPLPADAGAEAMQEAVVRIAWFVVTGAPRTPAPPSPELLTLRAVDASWGDVWRAHAVALAEASVAAPAALVLDAPTEPVVAQGNGSVAMITPANEGAWEGIASTVSGWMTWSGEELGISKPAPKSTEVMGTEIPLSVYIGLTGQVTRFNDSPAWMGGVLGGLLIDRTVGVGISYQSLSSTVRLDRSQVRPPANDESPWATDDLPTLEVDLLGLQVEYNFMPDKRLHANLSALLGAGLMGFEGDVREMLPAGVSDEPVTLLMIDLQGQVLYEARPWLQVGAGFGLRSVQSFGDGYISGDELEGVSGLLMVRAMLFHAREQ